jgi:hypothetical protein
MEVQAKLTISEQAISDIAVTAIEGGIGYWSAIKDYDYTNPKNYGVLYPTEDEEDFKPTKLTSDLIFKGVQQILRGDVQICKEYRQSILLAIVSDDMGEIDSGVADAIVQVGMFNRIYFG